MDRTTSRANRQIVVLAPLAMLLLAWLGGGQLGVAQDRTWQVALAAMPLPEPTTPLNRDNVVCVLLEAFRSNDVVKGLIVLPGVADDFYLVNRDRPKLNLRATNLLQAVTVLTNATAVQATFNPPWLLLHVAADRLQPRFTVQDPGVARRWKSQQHLAHALYCDTHWARVQPELQRELGQKIRPEAQSIDAWHFERQNLAAWGLSDWELLAAVSLASGTTFDVSKEAVVFRAR